MVTDIRIISWRDHFFRSAWHEPEQVIAQRALRGPWVITTIGYYVGEDEHHIYLSTSITGDEVPDAVFTQGILWTDIVTHEKIALE